MAVGQDGAGARLELHEGLGCPRHKPPCEARAAAQAELPDERPQLEAHPAGPGLPLSLPFQDPRNTSGRPGLCPLEMGSYVPAAMLRAPPPEPEEPHGSSPRALEPGLLRDSSFHDPLPTSAMTSRALTQSLQQQCPQAAHHPPA